MRTIHARQSAMAFTAAAIAAVGLAASPAFAAPTEPSTNDTPDAVTAESAQRVPFDHAVSLPDAVTINSAFGNPVRGYHFESDSIVGDYWIGSAQTLDQFLAETTRLTGTQPEVVAAYVDPEALTGLAEQSRTSDETRTIVTNLPEYDAPPGVPSDNFAPSAQDAREIAPNTTDVAALAANGRWDPHSAEVQIFDAGSFLNIVEKYTWGGPMNINDMIYNMPESWGMEFTIDFYSANRAWPPGTPVNFPGKNYRPSCADPSYKDWAAASNREFNWFAMVLDDYDYVYAPDELGFYGDYNDLSDECTRSSVSVGLAAPWRMPSSMGGTQDVMLSLYPNRGQASTSPIGAVIQAVERSTCEYQVRIPLTDCMGANVNIAWPGPGAASRGVLSSTRSWLAPNACWFSGNFGDDIPQRWECTPLEG
jgi:hypothetical protein